jgi:hypothetical protein
MAAPVSEVIEFSLYKVIPIQIVLMVISVPINTQEDTKTNIFRG